jgi:hypothetical protein
MQDKQPWIQLPNNEAHRLVRRVTTDRGIKTAQNDAAVMARPGDEVAAGDGLGAFGATFILPVKVNY